MATCPNCGQNIAWWNLKADCKNCGVSIPNHDWVNRLEEDNRKAEEQFLKFYKTMNRVKYSLWGTKLRIARLVLTFLPAIGFILPWADIKSSADSFQLTLLSFNHSKSAIDILLQLFSNMSVVTEGFKFEGFGGPVSYLVLGTGFYLLSAFFIVLAFLLNIIKCGKPKTKSTVTTDIISIIFSVIAVVFFSMSGGAGADVGAFSIGALNAIGVSGGISWGYFVALVLLLGAVGINVAVAIAPAKTDEELESERLAKVEAKEKKAKEDELKKERAREEAEKAAEEEQKRIVEEAKRKVAERKAKEEAKAKKK